MYASKNWYNNIVKILIENWADVNIKDNDRKTAFDYAKEKWNKEIVKILENKQS